MDAGTPMQCPHDLHGDGLSDDAGLAIYDAGADFVITRRAELHLLSRKVSPLINARGRLVGRPR
jgi:hypothetical protein